MGREKCPLCKYGHVAAGKTRCRGCLDMANIRSIRRAEKFRKKGLCPKCGKVPVKSGHNCPVCRQREAGAARKRYWQRREVGKCVRCGEEANGSAWCKKCKKQQTAWARRKRNGQTA